jgi:exonuclease III/ribonuclease HI
MLDPLTHSSPPSTLRLGTLNIGLGFLRKVPRLLQRCVDLGLDALAVQEIGDPAVLSAKLSPYLLVYAPGPSRHEAGVGLLLGPSLVPRVRSYKRSSTGRLIGAVLELSRGHSLLLVSAYMPTGLDHCSPHSEQHALAHQLYSELLRWSVGITQVVLMGDLNETLSVLDRLPRPAAAAAAAAATTPSPISHLVTDGFTDVYRHLHPHTPGFTHEIVSALRPSRSRIDYIWVKGVAHTSLVRARINTRVRDMTHHHLLWMEMQVNQRRPAACSAPLYQQRLPNLLAASPARLQSFHEHLQEQLQPQQADLHALADAADAPSLDQLAARLTGLVRASAFTCLPITGSAAGLNRSVLQLQRQRRDLTRLHTTSTEILRTRSHHSFMHSAEWCRLHRHCLELHPSLQWSIDPLYGGDPHGWLQETRQMIADTRAAIHRERRRMLTQKSSLQDERINPAAKVHQMLKSDALPTDLHSVVNARGELTADAAELETVMVDHFTAVFTAPPESDDPPADDRIPPRMLNDKPSVKAEWYDGLMAEVTEAELFDVLKHCKVTSAPGEDEVSSGMWKVALQGNADLRLLVLRLYSACLRTSIFPGVWKSSIIVPLIKDAHKERTMSNVRPISLQSCLGKLLNRVLAWRLSGIFARHPILHPAQRGFINGGSIHKCIDELLDAWEWSRNGKHELYTLFYDIKQAYDSVQRGVMIRALQRLRLPDSFVYLVLDSLTGLSSRVRTAYGLSRSFSVERSLRQGDPLAPLLFVILLDALHEGLERNPFLDEPFGLQLRIRGDVDATATLPSEGFADDTAASANTLPNLMVQNDWVHYFMLFNQMRLNHSKCELVGRGPDGLPVTAAALAAASITIEGHALVPLAHDKPIRYLGAHMSFDGSWKEQQRKALAKIAMFTRAISKFRVSLGHAVYMLRTFLMPMLELSLHYVCGAGTGKWLKSCDRLLTGCIRHAARSPLRLSNSALASALGFTLPSDQEVSIKMCELFLRMNSSDRQWGGLGRAVMRQTLPARIDSATPIPRPNGGNHISRAVYLAVNRLQWTLSLASPVHTAGRLQRLLHRDPRDTSTPSASQCNQIELASGPLPLVQNEWRGWDDASCPPGREVHAYTDGSHEAAALSDPLMGATSAWAVTIRDQWLDDRFHIIPSNECLVQDKHAKGATIIGASIACTSGIYPAELQAIARALAMTPASTSLHVHTDSQACIAAISKYEQLTNERRQMRMAARPLLQLISRLLRARAAAGGSLTLTHVKAHSADTDIDSVGNRLSDFHANGVRTGLRAAAPSSLQELPLAHCEPFLTLSHEQVRPGGLQIIDDVRLVAKLQRRQSTLARWEGKRSPVVVDGVGDLAGPPMVALGREVLRHGSPKQQVTFVHAATNSIQCRWAPPDDDPHGKEAVRQLQCSHCAVNLSINHLAFCAGPDAVGFRDQLRRSILALLAEAPCARAWTRQHRGLSLEDLLLTLFPNPVHASAEQVQFRSACLLSGAFTRAEAKSAARTVGFDLQQDADSARATFVRLRLMCLDGVRNFFDSQLGLDAHG